MALVAAFLIVVGAASAQPDGSAQPGGTSSGGGVVLNGGGIPPEPPHTS